MPLKLLFGVGQSLDVTLHDAVVSFDHVMPNHAGNGELSGVVATTDFLLAVQELAGRLDKSFCSGSAFASIATEITQASDIMKDGTNADLIGPVKTVGPAALPQPNPCDAGAD
jgi:hypothetical protein